MARTFTRAERLTHKRQFDRVFEGGRAFRCPKATVLALPNGEGCSRLGLSVGRRVGGAVRRNRIKRVVREAFRLNKELLAIACDLVVIPRRDWKDVTLGSIEEDFRRVLRDVAKAFAG
jgi:ribonuclease P protein component